MTPFSEHILMTRPQLRSFIPGNVACMAHSADCVPMRQAQSASKSVSVSTLAKPDGLFGRRPQALLTRMSTRPKCCWAAPTMSCTAARSLTSVVAKPTFTPNSDRISAAADSPAAALISASHSEAPSAAKRRARPLPMPAPAPVIRATRPCSLFI
ncbi:hypothetical protein D3C87_1407170 [compost metagenome]